MREPLAMTKKSQRLVRVLPSFTINELNNILPDCTLT